jgi:hypothetical protein
MPYTVALPDGRTVEFPDSVSREDAAAIIRRQLGGVTQPKDSTIGSELVRGAKQLASTTRTGIGALTAPEEAARAGVERGQQIAAEAGEGPSFAALRKAYEERGLLPAAGELVSQIPRALAGQGAQLAAMAGGAKLGAMAGTAVAPGVGTIAGGILGAGATLLPQFFGSNVERQAAEQMERGEPVKIDRGTAAAAAAGQAGIEAAGTALVLGKRVVKGLLGVTDDAALATAKAREELVKAAGRSRLGAAGRGAAVGVAEIPVEIAQAVIERAQAGLDVLSPEALSEYGENAYLAGLVGPTIGAATRVTEPGAARRKLAVEEQAKAAEERAATAKAEAEKKKDPAYVLGIADEYDALSQQKEALKSQIVKGTKEAPLTREAADRNAIIQKQISELDPQIKEKRNAYLAAGGPDAVKRLREQKRIEAMTPEEYAEYSYAQRAVPGAPRAAAPVVEETLSPDFADPLAAFERGPSQPVLDYVAAQMRTAQRLDQGNFDVSDYAQFLMQDPRMARQVVAERPAIPGVSEQESAAILDGLKLQLDALGGDIAAGREAAGYERKQTDIEQQVAREQAARSAALQQQLGFEGTAEREAMQELAADRASDMRARELGALRTAPQLAMFPEEQAPTTRVGEGTPPAIPEATDLEAGFKRFFTEPAPARTPETQQRDVRPQEPLTQRLDTLAERILAAPNVDDATKDLVERVQGNLPEVAAQLRAQTEALSQRAPQRGVAPRVTPRSVAQGDELTQVADWAQSVLQGRASPEMTSDIRAAVQALEAGRRSETEQVTQYAGRRLTPEEQGAVAGTSLEGRQGVMTREPTGEVRRAVQTEIAMPEPTAKAFESFGAFNDYLASEGLQAYRTQKGLVFPTLSNLQRRLAPIQARVQELQKQLDDVNAKREALQKADAAERGAASELLRESQQKLQATVQTLDDTARTTYVGQKLKQVDLVDLLDQAHGRLNAALAHSANLRDQFAQALSKIASADDATTTVMVDAKGNATTNEKAAVKTVAKGQLPGYQALRKVQLDMQAKGNALVAADEKLGEVVRAGIGQSWDAGSPTLNAYLRAKKAKDEAQRAAQQAHFAMLQAYKRIPSTEKLNANLSKFLTEKGTIDAEMARAAKSLSAIRLGVRNASNRLNDSYVRMENNPEFRFGENLLRLRQDLLAAQNISEEAMGRSVERQAQAGALAKEAKVIAQPMRTMERQVSTAMREAQERAAARQPKPPVETQSEREAKDAEKRREEQARLERQEAIPATRIEFERAETDNQETRKLLEAVADAPSTEERAAARKTLDEHLKALVARKDAELDEMKRKAAKNVQDLNTQRKAVAELTERLKGDLTPKRRESAEKQLAEAKRKMAEHERRYTLNTREMKIKRTDIQAQREERNRLLAEASGRRVEGERLGVEEGTQQRAIGPVTRAEVTPPKALRTASPESRAGETATDTRQKLTEARGERQRDVALSKKEQAEANRIAAELAKKTPEQKAAAAKEEAKVQEEQAKLQPKPAKVTPLKEAAEKRKTKPTRSEVIEDIDEDLYEEPEIEILGGPNEEVFFSRGPTEAPSTTASVRTELSKAFPDLGRVQIYDSVDALVAANPQYKGLIESDVRGFVDTAGNKAFLIAENINKGDALAVLLHEVGAHIGLKNMLGTTQYNALVKAVETWAKKNDGSVESRVAKTALERVEAAKTPANQKADETLAYAIEEAVKAGVKPMETKGVLGQWLSQIATLFRKALEKFGLPPKSLDAQGLVDMAFGAAKMEMTPAVPQMSRRNFLRGAGAALGAMKLPPLSKEMNLRALRSVFEASLDARGAWFGALKTAVKSKGLGRVIDQYEDMYEGDNALVNFTQSNALQEFLQSTTYDENYQGDGYDYYLNELLSGKDGVKIVADLQQALRAQGASLVEAAQKTAKEKGLPEVGELFFSAPETGRVIDITKQLKERTAALEEKRDQLEDEADFKEYESIKSELRQLAKDAYERDILALWPKIQAAKKLLQSTKYPGSLEAKALEKAVKDFQTDYIDRYNKLQDVTQEQFDYKTLDRLVRGSLPQELALFDNTFTALSGTQKPAAAPKEVLFSRNLPTASRVADSLIAKEKGWVSKLKDNFLGMGFRTQFVDKLAPSEEALKRGGTDPTKALQAMYYLRMYDQRMHFTSQSITEGVPELVEKTRRDGTTERLIETKAGANIQQIVDILKGKDVVKAAGSADGANKLFTLYLAAIRGERVGYDTLNFGRVWAEAEVKRIESQLKATTISQEQRAVLQKRKKSLEEKIPTMPTAADIKAARAEIESDPTLKKAFDEARDIYNKYNRNLLEFSVQTGALSREQANEYLRNNDYIPYYRMRDGVAEMVIGNETPIRIGNLKDSPHLKELVGGDEAIFDFLTSSVQNTSMLLDMATKNLATKNLMFELRDVGLATVAKVPKSGKTPEGAVTFKRDGEDHYAVVDTDTIGIDSDLLVKGLAGIPTMFPAFVRVLGVPARLLRRVVVASPVYMARQLFRDSLAAAMTSGADIVPVLGSLKQIGKPNVLQGRGITGGQVFTGMPEDVTRMLKDMQAGKISVTNGLSYLEAKAAQVDALTRKAQYDSYLAQGLSEMEATYMALESMNFSKRGLSPTVHMASTLIPFFNAQIQGLDVLYKSFTGQMPLNERLAIREKLWTRGLMLAGLSMAYALAMQDDETYENAKPEEKYGNWFVQIPGFEQMVRLPIPFELGYIFKALPEALVNTLSNEQGGEEAMKAFKHIAQQMVPGASSYFLPQAVKPALETLIGTSLYTGRSIESTQEQMMEPGYRYRDNTTALAREVGELTGFSPVKMEFLIRGYTGSMGMALLAALSAPFGSEGPEAATKRASDMPVVGTLFQPKDASGIIDATYDRMQQVNRVKETYEGLLNKGRQADAEKYLKENIDEMALASVAGSFKQYMGQITEYERQIRASSLTPEKKREALDQARQAKIQLATSVRAASERKAPQAAPA